MAHRLRGLSGLFGGGVIRSVFPALGAVAVSHHHTSPHADNVACCLPPPRLSVGTDSSAIAAAAAASAAATLAYLAKHETDPVRSASIASARAVFGGHDRSVSTDDVLQNARRSMSETCDRLAMFSNSATEAEEYRTIARQMSRDERVNGDSSDEFDEDDDLLTEAELSRLHYMVEERTEAQTVHSQDTNNLLGIDDEEAVERAGEDAVAAIKGESSEYGQALLKADVEQMHASREATKKGWWVKRASSDADIIWSTDDDANAIRKKRINKIETARYEGKSAFVRDLAKAFNSSELSEGRYQSHLLFNRTDVAAFGEMLELAHPPAKAFIERCIKFNEDFCAANPNYNPQSPADAYKRRKEGREFLLSLSSVEHDDLRDESSQHYRSSGAIAGCLYATADTTNAINSIKVGKIRSTFASLYQYKTPGKQKRRNCLRRSEGRPPIPPDEVDGPHILVDFSEGVDGNEAAKIFYTKSGNKSEDLLGNRAVEIMEALTTAFVFDSVCILPSVSQYGDAGHGTIRNNRLFLSNVREVLELNEKGELGTHRNGGFFARFYMNTLYAYSDGSMFPERVKYLERINFFNRVDPASRFNEEREQLFREQLQGLCDYLTLHDFVYPPESPACRGTKFCTAKEQKKVSRFIKRQRQLFYNLTVKNVSSTYHIENKHRIEALNAMNFIWSPRDEQPWAYKSNGYKIADIVSKF